MDIEVMFCICFFFYYYYRAISTFYYCLLECTLHDKYNCLQYKLCLHNFKKKNCISFYMYMYND